MSQIATRAAGLIVAPLPMAMVAGDATAVAIAQAAVPAPAADSRAIAAPAASGTAAATDATAGVKADPAMFTAGHAALPAAAAPGTTAAPATFTRPAAATSAQVGTPSAFPAPPSAGGGIGGAVTALIVVIALILALAWLAKRMPVLGGGAGSNPALRIVGSLALGPRERVVVVAVGDTQLLLGVGAGGTRTLHTLSEPLPVAASTTPAFAQLLAQHFGKKA